MNKMFGIDLGTTDSCLARVDESGKAEVSQDFEGASTTASVVFFDEGIPKA